MDDKFYLYDILSSFKALNVNMSYAINECSSDNLYKKFVTMQNEISSATKDLFYIAFNNNWYNLKNDTKENIMNEYTKLQEDLENTITNDKN